MNTTIRVPTRLGRQMDRWGFDHGWRVVPRTVRELRATLVRDVGENGVQKLVPADPERFAGRVLARATTHRDVFTVTGRRILAFAPGDLTLLVPRPRAGGGWAFAPQGAIAWSWRLQQDLDGCYLAQFEPLDSTQHLGILRGLLEMPASERPSDKEIEAEISEFGLDRRHYRLRWARINPDGTTCGHVHVYEADADACSFVRRGSTVVNLETVGR